MTKILALTPVSPACNDKHPFGRWVTKQLNAAYDTELQFIIGPETFRFHSLILRTKTIYTIVLAYCTASFTRAQGHSQYTHAQHVTLQSCTYEWNYSSVPLLRPTSYEANTHYFSEFPTCSCIQNLPDGKWTLHLLSLHTATELPLEPKIFCGMVCDMS
jgi:hypothetical protein